MNAVPDLSRLQGVVAPEILTAVATASTALREAGIPHALIGGLAVGAHGYPRTTSDVNFLVGDEAFIVHPGGLVTLKLPLVAVGNVRIDLLSIEPTAEELQQLRPAIEGSMAGGPIPIIPIAALVYLKLKANRQKDLADIVELLKRGRIDIGATEQYLMRHAPEFVEAWRRVAAMAAREE